jgi:AcrR family transcriptional regulator
MTKKASKEIRTNDIIEAAINEFLEKGYENTSMDSIAKRAGLTKGGLYYHFKSKDDILIKANEGFMMPIYKMMNEAILLNSSIEGLTTYIKNYLTHWHTHPKELSFVFLTFMKTLTNDKITNIYNGYTVQYINFFEALYRKGIENNEFKSVPAKAAACALMSALDGIIGYIVLDNTISPEMAIDYFTEVFVNQYIIKN